MAKSRLFVCCTIFLSLLYVAVEAQGNDTLYLDRAKAETIFLENNIPLLVEKLNIKQADARVIQARLWPNPSFSIGDVNLWTTKTQKSQGNELAPLIGKYGKYQQVTMELDQLVYTAGKRKKGIAIEMAAGDRSKAVFEELLRALKVEFRNKITTLQYNQIIFSYFEEQVSNVKAHLDAYENQAKTGNINRSEVIRLQALLMDLRNRENEISRSSADVQADMRMLMNLPDRSYLVFDTAGFYAASDKIAVLSRDEMVAIALENRPDLKITKTDMDIQSKALALEQAKSVPDLNFKIAYDRGGGFVNNFVGVGVGLDLPVFNRNQGNIMGAKIELQKADLYRAEKENTIKNEVVKALDNFQISRDFYRSIKPEYQPELQKMLESYTRNFKQRNISMLEYLDFMDAYINNIKTILEAKKSLNQNIEELNYVVGKDVE